MAVTHERSSSHTAKRWKLIIGLAARRQKRQTVPHGLNFDALPGDDVFRQTPHLRARPAESLCRRTPTRT